MKGNRAEDPPCQKLVDGNGKPVSPETICDLNYTGCLKDSWVHIVLASASARATAAAAFTCLVAVAAKDRTISARLKGYSGWLSAAGANNGRTLSWSRAITGSPLVSFLCHTA